MGSSSSKSASKLKTLASQQTLPTATRESAALRQPVRASETKSKEIEQDGHDPTFLRNLSAMGQVSVPPPPILTRADNRMLDILSQRKASEAAEETPSDDRISAQSLSNLFDDCKAASTRAEIEALAKEYGITLAVLERLGRHVTSPSVTSSRTRKEERQETQTARWVDPPALKA